MKANEAPEKIYLRHNNKGDIGAGWLVFPLTDNDIEYVRADTLEVEEVDLDAELEHYKVEQNIKYEEDINMFEFAKHFFELGLKAQNKITPLQQQRISVLKMEFWTGLQTFNESEMTLSDAYNKGIEDVLEELGLQIVQKGE